MSYTDVLSILLILIKMIINLVFSKKNFQPSEGTTYTSEEGIGGIYVQIKHPE
jgi:hypothetical protein